MPAALGTILGQFTASPHPVERSDGKADGEPPVRSCGPVLAPPLFKGCINTNPGPALSALLIN